MNVPKPARESRTLRFNKIVSIAAAVLALIPSALSYAIDLLGNPEIAALVADAIPVQYRTAIAVIVFAIAQRNRQLRMQTTAPIAESMARLRRDADEE